MPDVSTVLTVFKSCVNAIDDGQLIHRTDKKDKEFHFQDWVSARLAETGFYYEAGGRNKYPDFRMVNFAEGYEVKGLAYPGREVNYDANSQIPSGSHNGRTIFYIFGRYPKEPDGDSYPVLDLVICHGDFLNADREYIHRNKSIKGFGSYGDIMIRDRKMYVVPTPFGLTSGMAHRKTLILPENFPASNDFKQVGMLARVEADKIIVNYTFNLRSNDLVSGTIPNPYVGREHLFRAWRLKSGSDDPVVMQETVVLDTESGDDDLDE